jgi:hypothetical protein
MTYETFLAKLRETPRDWRLTIGGAIRRGGRYGHLQCAVSSLQNRCTDEASTVGDVLGLDRSLRHEIENAADGLLGHAPQTRADLLAACGLSQPPDPLVTP